VLNNVYVPRYFYAGQGSSLSTIFLFSSPEDNDELLIRPKSCSGSKLSRGQCNFAAGLLRIAFSPTGDPRNLLIIIRACATRCLDLVSLALPSTFRISDDRPCRFPATADPQRRFRRKRDHARMRFNVKGKRGIVTSSWRVCNETPARNLLCDAMGNRRVSRVIYGTLCKGRRAR